MSRTRPAATVLNAAAANGIGSAQQVDNMNAVILSLNTTGNTTATIKFQASLQDAVPDFSAPASPTNQWSYVELVNLDDGTTVHGSTGIALTGTDVNNMYEFNTNALKWCNAIVSGYSAGAISVQFKPYSNA